MAETSPRMLYKAMAPDKATCIYIAISLHIWDAMSIAEREAWCERGEVFDTPAGNVLARAIRNA